MWQLIYKAIRWLVDAPDPLPEQYPLRERIVPNVDPRPTPPVRTLADIDCSIGLERAVWELERRAGEDTAGAVASRARLDVLLDERCRAMALLSVRRPPRRAQSRA